MRKLFIVIVGMVFAFALAINVSAKALTGMSKSMYEFVSDSTKMAEDFKLVKESVSLTLGGTGYNISAKSIPAGSTIGKISYDYSSSNIKIDEKGHITAVTATDTPIKITVKVEGLEGKDKIFTVNSITDANKQNSQQNQNNKTAVNTTDYQKVVDSLKGVSRQLNEANSELQKVKTEKGNLEEKLKSADLKNPRNTKIIRNLTIFVIIIGILLLVALIQLIRLYKIRDELKDENNYLNQKNKSIESQRSHDYLTINTSLNEKDELKKENQRLRKIIDDLNENIQRHNSEPPIEETQTLDYDNKKFSENEIKHRVEDKIDTKHTQKQKFSLYSDAIVDGSLNKVKERPNDDTIFELILNEQNSTSAKVVIYSGAKRRIIANASFLEGCEKQIIGSNDVVVEREGTAEKDSTTGVWNLIKRPKVLIK